MVGDLTQTLQPASAIPKLCDFDIHPIKQGNPEVGERGPFGHVDVLARLRHDDNRRVDQRLRPLGNADHLAKGQREQRAHAEDVGREAHVMARDEETAVQQDRLLQRAPG